MSHLYSIPYVILIVILGILAFLLHQRKDDEEFCHKVKAGGVLLFFLFFAFRGFIFTDWMSYYVEFEKCSIDDFHKYTLLIDREPGWILFELLCKLIFNNYHFLVFMSTLVNTWLLLLFLKRHTSNILLGLVLYLVFEGFVISANLMRNSISIFIFINALQYLENRKPVKYFLLCTLAFCFHYSSIIFFPLYFFLHIKLNKWIFLALFISCIVIFIFRIPVFMKLISLAGFGGEIINAKIEAYADMSYDRGLGIGFFERLMTGTLVLCYYDRITEDNYAGKIFVNALLIYFITNFMFSDLSEISLRIGTLFVFSYWVIWDYLIGCFSIDNNRKLFLAFIAIYCILKTVATIKWPVNEYDNLLLGNMKSYQERKYIFEKTFVPSNEQ